MRNSKELRKPMMVSPNVVNTALLGIVLFFCQQSFTRLDRIETKQDVQNADIAEIKGFLHLNISALQPVINMTKLDINSFTK